MTRTATQRAFRETRWRRLRSSRVACIAGLAALAGVPAQSVTALAQEGSPLEMVVEGWGRGVWEELHSVGLNPETGTFEGAEDSPWSRWEVRAIGPTMVDYTMSDGIRYRVEIADGVYRDFGAVREDGSVGEPSEAAIVEQIIHAPTDWRLLILWKALPDAPTGEREYSELVMMGDLFIWSNWIESTEGMRRVFYGVNRLAGE